MNGGKPTRSGRAANGGTGLEAGQAFWTEVELPRLKAQVRAEVERRMLTPLMNDTRWREVRTAVGQRPFSPPYQRQDVLGPRESLWFSDDVTEGGDWSHESLEPFFSIEWVRIVPRLRRQVGHLLPLRPAGDCTDQLRDALGRLGLSFREDDRGFWVYGYSTPDPGTGADGPTPRGDGPG